MSQSSAGLSLLYLYLTSPSKTFLEKAFNSLKEMFKNNSQISNMKKKFLNLQTLLNRKEDFEVTDEHVKLTDAEMQTIEDALAQKQKDLDEKSQLLDTANQKVKDLEADIKAKDQSIKDKDTEINNLKGAPGGDTHDDVQPEVDSVDPGTLYNAMKQIN